MFIFEAINKNISIWEAKKQLEEIVLDIVEKKNEYNETPLIVASKDRSLTWVDFLLSLGANPKDVNSLKQNALQLLIDKEVPVTFISSLIELGVDPNNQDTFGQSPLFYAFKYNRQDIVHLFLSEGANPDLLDCEGNSPLLIAALSGNPRNVELLLEAGVEIDVSNSRGQTALHMAALGGSEEVVKLLLEAGFSIAGKDILGRSALHYASMQENPNITTILANAGVDLDAADEEGFSALMLASKQGLFKQVEELLKVGANPNNPDQNNEKSIIKALEQEPIGHYHILAGEKIDVDPGQKIKGVTEDLSFMNEAIRVCGSSTKENLPNHFMVKSSSRPSVDQYAKVAELLLNSGTDFDLTNDFKMKPELLEQVKHNQTLLKILVNHEQKKSLGQLNVYVPPEKKAVVSIPKVSEEVQAHDTKLADFPINSRDANGVPYLVAFASSGKHEMVELLLKQGNDYKIRDRLGRTALIAAAQAGHTDTVKVLLDYDKDINFKTPRGENALLIAVMEKKFDTALLLLNAGANPDTRFKGAYILHLVAGSGRVDLAQAMLQHGANPRVKDIKGFTPAQYAKAKGHVEMEGILGGPKENS